jgi:S1-C subfamily serine protease
MRSRSLGFAAIVGAMAVLLYVTGGPWPVSPARSVEPRGPLNEPEQLTVSIFEKVSPSVVQVAVRGPASAYADESSPGASGTGFIWDASGHVVTNDHVVQNARAVAVRFASGEVTQAEVVGLAPAYDLAVLRIRGAKQLPAPVTIGTSSDLKVGQMALAIGNPFGLDQSLTTGVISALKRRLPTSGGREISGVIQTDAAINPGNSGGPLLDSAGRLIGVNTAIISPSGTSAGIGFAVPVDVVNRVVPELIRNGRVPTPGIGIVAANETVATRLGVEGVVVIRVAPGSPAERSGIRGVDATTGTLGDVIVEAEGRPIRMLSDLTAAIEQAGVGRSLRLSVHRESQKRSIDVNVIDIGRS